MKKTFTFILTLVLMLTMILGTEMSYAATGLTQMYPNPTSTTFITSDAVQLKINNLSSYSMSSDVQHHNALSVNETWTVAQPAKGGTATYSGTLASPVLKLVYDNCGTVMGRQTRVIISITKVQLKKRKSNSGTYSGNARVAFAFIKKKNLWLGASTTSADGHSGHIYGGEMYVTYTMQVQTMDDGKAYKLPLYHSHPHVGDLGLMHCFLLLEVCFKALDLSFECFIVSGGFLQLIQLSFDGGV